MRNKGFTLIELLAVIALLSIILMIVVPSIFRSFDNSKENLYNIMIDNICDSATNYYEEYKSGLITPDEEMCVMDNDRENCSIEIRDLIKGKYLNANLKNPLTNKDISFSDVQITLSSTGVLDTNNNETYTIEVIVDGDRRVCNQ